MNRIILILCLSATFFATSAFSQQLSEIDSILAILPNLQGDEKLDAIGVLTELTSDLPMQRQYVDMYLDEARRQKNIQAESNAYMMLIPYYAQQLENDSVFIIGEEAIHFARQHKLYDNLFLTYHNIIQFYNVRGQTLTALRKAEEAHTEAKELKENFYIARMLSAMGEIYHSMMQQEEALRCFSESLELALQKRRDDTFFYIETYNYLASITGYMNLDHEMLQYADSMQVEIDRFRINNPTINLQLYDFCVKVYQAGGYARLGQKVQAQQALRSAEALFDPLWEGTTYDVLLYAMYSKYYLAIGDFDKALKYIKLKRHYFEENNLIAELDDPDEAEAYLGKGDLKSAIIAYQQIIQRKDEYNREQFYKQINELRTIYELDKAELEVERRQATIQRLQFTVTIFVISVFALLLIIALVVWNNKRINEKNKALYRQIKERDRLVEQFTTHKEALESDSSQPTETEMNGKTSENIEKKKQYLIVNQMNDYLMNDRNFAKPDINIDKIARQIGVSRTALYQAIKDVKGDEKPQEYIYTFRLEEARRLLDKTDEQIKLIASVCGYTPSTFFRQFQEKYKISPAEYRKISRQETEK